MATFDFIDFAPIKYSDCLHLALFDGSDTVMLRTYDNIINWKKIRSLGQLPFFAVSWSVLGGVILLLNLIRYLNHAAVSGTRVVDWVQYPIPVPERLAEILTASTLLAIGSTLYKVFCPAVVQEFTESAWVEKGNPRLLYIAHSLRKPIWQIITIIFLAYGALLSLVVLGRRVIQAFDFLFTGG